MDEALPGAVDPQLHQRPAVVFGALQVRAVPQEVTAHPWRFLLDLTDQLEVNALATRAHDVAHSALENDAGMSLDLTAIHPGRVDIGRAREGIAVVE